MNKKNIITFILIIIVDQVSKFLINQSFTVHESRNIIGTLVKFTYVLNPGGAFGTRFGGSLFYLFITIAATVVLVVYYFFNKQENKLMQSGLLLVLAGAIGNLIDRIRLGEVIDFINCGIGKHRWPTFNIADSAITIGLIILIIASLKQDVREEDKDIGTQGDRTDQD